MSTLQGPSRHRKARRVLAPQGTGAVERPPKYFLEHEENAGKPFPSYARLLPLRGKAEADSRYSWTVDFATRRAKAREEIQPILKQAAETKAEVIDLKEALKRLKKLKASDSDVTALIAEITDKEKAARELEAQASAIDAAVFDLKAVNPGAVAKFDERSPAEIIQSIHDHGQVVAEALSRLASMVGYHPTNVPPLGSTRK